jgi:hypothetical protein
MSTFWIAVVALAVVPDAGSTPAADFTPAVVVEQALVPPRTGRELRDAVRAALRRWARASGKEAGLAAREFLVLYEELGADDQLSGRQRDELLTKVRGRLLKLADEISKRVAIEKRLAKQRRPESVDAAVDGVVLAQFGGMAQPRGMAVPGFAGLGPRVGMLGGGPFGGAGQFGNDYGPELVDLIQQTIAPQSWDVNGGLGSIYYWRPGRALVIRQTGNVHDQIGGLLQQLGRMGR